MTTLEQQIAHFRDYWKVPQEDIDVLVKLVFENYFSEQAAKRKEFWDKAITQMKANNSYSEETIWGKPVGEEVW